MIFRAREAIPEPRALAGFLLSGFLFSLLGALLPAWGYDVSGDYAAVGRYFLAIVLGMVASGTLVRRIAPRLGPRSLLIAGCSTAILALLSLAFLPDHVLARAAGLFVLGASAGLLHTGLFEAAVPAYDRSPALAVIAAGIFFGMGSISAALLVDGTLYVYSVPSILLILAVLPAIFIVLYARKVYPPAGLVSHPKVLKQFRSGAAILFSLLLFFQFGNEWSIAGWLPLFLIHRLGASPKAGLGLLVFYFAALTAGRVAIYYLLPRVNHWLLILLSAGGSMLGCVGSRNQWNVRRGCLRRSNRLGFCLDLSDRRQLDWPPLPLLPSRFLQRHLFLCSRRRHACALGMASWRALRHLGHRYASGSRHLHVRPATLLHLDL